MAGHMITRYLASLNKYEIIDASLEKLTENTIILNVENKELLNELLNENKPNIVINCIGLLIKASEENPSLAIYLNSFLPHYLSELGDKLNYKLIHLSTDCVFSGKKGGYHENDVRDGEDHYARTKALGEIINDKHLTFRTSIIGPELKTEGTGLLHWFLTKKDTIKGFSKVYWTGLTTLELAKAIDQAIEQDLTGLYHLVPDHKISKYNLLKLISEIKGMSIKILKDEEYISDKSLINNRKDFNYQVPDYRKMLIELFDWMKNWSYKQYET